MPTKIISKQIYNPRVVESPGEIIKSMNNNECMQISSINNPIKCPIGLDNILENSFNNMHVDIIHIKEKQSENFEALKLSVNKLYDTIMDPENGLYSRLIYIEKAKENITKWLWGIIITLSGTAVTGLVKLLF